LVVADVVVAEVAAEGVDVAGVAEVVGGDGVAGLIGDDFCDIPDRQMVLAGVADGVGGEAAFGPAPVVLAADEGPAAPVFGVLGAVHGSMDKFALRETSSPSPWPSPPGEGRRLGAVGLVDSMES